MNFDYNEYNQADRSCQEQFCRASGAISALFQVMALSP